MSVFGFSTEQSAGGSGDFTPVLKYDSRAGRLFRSDRTEVDGRWVTVPVDITKSFKAIFDMENLETGWIEFTANSAPVFSVVKLGEPLPPKPTPNAKNGARVMLKLGKDCGGDKPIRELAGNSKTFLQGLEELYIDYAKDKSANPGMLPVVVLDDTVPITSGSGEKKSTNYRPVFKITGWAPRGDLVWSPKNGEALAPMPSVGAPDTGSTRVDPPKAKVMETVDDLSDFG